MLRFKHVIALLLAGSAQIGQALVVRADVPIASYEQEARRLPGYCRLNLPDGGGVLIASQWVLTAAHLASDVKPGHRFQCEREDEIVDKVVVYPAFDENIGRHDLALIRLAKPSKLKPVRLRREVVPGDTLASLIGHYQGGTGLTGGVGRSPAGLRGGKNRVAAADRTWLRFVFDPPGSKATSALEAVSGSGDSGAPAYMLEGRDASVIGIGSRSSDTNKNGIEQDYGDTDLYVPVASYLAWIDQVTSRSRTATTTSRVRAFAQVDGDIFDELSRQGFSGAAAVYQDGHLVLERAAGQANARNSFRVATKVDIASITKPITALAIFRLIEQGKLTLDDPLSRWFPEVPADKRTITIRQMLNHTSGLVDIPRGMSDYRVTTAAEMRDRIFAEPLDFAPGTKNNYSNSGFNLLGMIVERASGKSLFEFLDDAVFRPAGVRASYDPEAFPAADVASANTDTDTSVPVRQLAAMRNGPFWGLWGAGGIFMSASDLVKIFEAFHDGRIISRASAERMTQNPVPAGSYASEALGWTIIHTSRGEDFLSYTGGSEHSTSALRYYPNTRLVLAVVANSASPGAVRVARALAEPIVGRDFTPNSVPAGVPPLALAPADDVSAIRKFIAAVASSPAARLDYVRTAFAARTGGVSGEQALVEKIGNLASIGSPKIISIYRRGADTVLMFETQESEYPRLYELVLRRNSPAAKILDYKVSRVTP